MHFTVEITKSIIQGQFTQAMLSISEFEQSRYLGLFCLYFTLKKVTSLNKAQNKLARQQSLDLLPQGCVMEHLQMSFTLICSPEKFQKEL